jgi:UDP-N-acetylmuramoyl-L-alanyl-D-glutamate--2,6-diaminopimelate ligase
MIEFETNSKKIKPGQTFVAIKGFTVDGHDYINSAIENGATKVVGEEDIDCSVPYIKVNSSKDYLKEQLVEKYSKQFDDLHIIGVTGTNGKTTTCYLTYQFLNELGLKAAYMGTIGFYYDDVKIELPNTTPEILTVYNLIMEAKEHGCKYIVMEVSSHSLEEERIAGLKFDVCAFTNLTQDHLDFHKTMDNYLNAKLKIFNYLKKSGTMIVNNDDSYASNFIKDNSLTFGYKEDSDVVIKEATYTALGTNIKFEKDNKLLEVNTNLTSKFNVYNYLTCYLILNSLGIKDENIINITKDIKPPKGRCEIIKAGKGVAVIDYAHTPDAVEKVINSFNELKENRVITIVGCGGDRDPIKRPIMGDIACKLSDHVIFTNDNPRTEDPKNIMNDITKDLKYNNFEIIFDRVEAIFKGIDMMEDNDILLILGKGHEDYQIIGHEKIHYDDHETVQKWIEEHK